MALGVFLIVCSSHVALVAWRLARCIPGVVTLDDSSMTIVDPSVFREPLVIARADICAIASAPIGRWVGSAARSANAALVSLIAEKPTVLVVFRSPRQLTVAKRNVGLQSTFPLRSPSARKTVNELWLRTADQSGVATLTSQHE